MIAARPEAGAAPLTPERYRDVKAIVQAALDRPPDERAAFVAGACGADAALRNEVEGLLAAAVASDGFLEGPAPLRAPDESSGLMARVANALRDQYVLTRELAEGGMSRVFLALQLVPVKREVVVKVLRPDLAYGVSVERFAREVEFAARLQQANIVTVHTAGEADGIPYYTMPYVRGDSLRTLLTTAGRSPIAQSVGILKDVAKALAYAHAEGVVHRDIKPENVLLSGGTAVVTDFGIAKAITASRAGMGSPSPPHADPGQLTNVGISVGTPAYMAPEQVAGDPEVGPAADVYAFGIVAYELLAGVHPFADRRGAVALMAAHISQVPAPLAQHRSELPGSLVALVTRCLDKQPGNRPADGAALVAALEAAEQDARTGAPLWNAATPSIAVLPFANLSAGPENDYFSDGITEEVLSVLTRMRGLRVAARTSAFAFKSQSVDLRTMAQQLGVRTILEGSVRRSGSRVRIGVRLVSAADGLTLWSERYDREFGDILAVQDDIAQAIARALERTLTGGAAVGTIANTGRSRRETVNPDAFELYLRGRHLLEQRAEGMHEALRCFEQAIRIDPEFSPSHAGIAYAYNLFGLYNALRPGDAFPRARDAADRALTIDPADALALVMRAHVTLWHEWDFAAAEARARRALELAPGMHLAHDCLGFVLAAQGRFDEAITSMQRARELDPLSQYASYDLAWVLVLARRWDQAIRELQPALARHPQDSELRRAFAFCLFYAGRLREARQEFEHVLQLNAGDRWGSGNLGQALAALGEMEEARRLVAETEHRAEHEPVPLFGIAIVHHWLGDDEAALRWLARSVDARDPWLVMLRQDPSMARLRGDPRFEAIMDRVRATPSP